ncbi:MAG TPA: hypothetical protein VMP68_17770 [Candidatus Eisenbacteria bacterium]|nr:hypothetical protein [Candidatus Eisenbacteria bacterium]
MTLAQRLSGEITDIKSIEFVCKQCGTSVAFEPAKWNGVVPHSCSNCPTAKARTWMEVSRESIDMFAILLTQIVKAAKDLPFEIRLNFNLTESGEPETPK